MSGRAAARAGSGFPRLLLLPFLDIVFSTIGIIVVFIAVHITRSERPFYPPDTDHIAVCVEPSSIDLYVSRQTDPVAISVDQITEVIETVAAEATGVTNMVFAFNESCFGLRRALHASYRNAIRLQEDVEAADAQTAMPVFRLRDWPLESDTAAADRLIARWRGETEGGAP
ncbi:MAG: hypothetical protein H6842_11110 [Rhodospirillaceae bacterium]|nr:hypothetical protein [Rhodospirillaceae bacterium]